jgi:uncharacterized protein
MTGESQQSRNLAVLVWVATIFLGFIPGLIVCLVKRDDAYVSDQSKEALNWAITALIANLAGVILRFFLISTLVFVVVGICHFAFCVMGAIAASGGKRYRVPFAIRLIK